MNIHRCPVCNGSGEALSAAVQGLKKGQWGWFRQVICTLCYGTGQVSEQLARRIIIDKEGRIIMKNKIEFADDILIIDELDDGGTYHVTVPIFGVNELTSDPRSAVNIPYPNDDEVEIMQADMEDAKRVYHGLKNKLDEAVAVQKASLELRDLKLKMEAAIKLITADTSIYHRFWGEVRTVSVDKDGNVSFGPRAMNRERPGEG
jgi:hypothetical protein